MKKSKYLTVREMAERLRVSSYTIKRWIKSGKIEGKRVGKRGDWRIKTTEIAKVLK